MNIDQYIHEFHASQIENTPSSASSPNWFFKNPTTVKVAEASTTGLGVASLALLPLTLPVLGPFAIAAAVVGGVAAGVSVLAHKTLDLAVSPHHDMSRHVFTPGTHGVGKLYYQGDIPILELESDDPYQAGVAHGYLMGPALNYLLGRMDWVKNLASMPQADKLPETIQAILDILPAEYISELEGIVSGFNQWSTDRTWCGKTLTIGDLVAFHLMPDSLHFSPQKFESNFKESTSAPLMGTMSDVLGCTVVIDKDKKKGLTFGRNMDWPSFGVFGTYSIVINRKHKNGKFPTKTKLSTVELGFPGFVGTLTGMNKTGLSLAMNVCAANTDVVRGLPAAFFNRMCLENCHNVQEMNQLIFDKKKPLSPLGGYHLSVADEKVAKSFHFYQGTRGEHVVRNWKEGKPLITTNCRYGSGREEDETHHMHYSEERRNSIQQLFKGAQELIKGNGNNGKLVEASLSLPLVNNSITTQKVVMHPQSKKIQLVVDNAFAGQAELHNLDTTTLF